MEFLKILGLILGLGVIGVLIWAMVGIWKEAQKDGWF